MEEKRLRYHLRSFTECTENLLRTSPRKGRDFSFCAPNRETRRQTRWKTKLAMHLRVRENRARNEESLGLATAPIRSKVSERRETRDGERGVITTTVLYSAREEKRNGTERASGAKIEKGRERERERDRDSERERKAGYQ